MKQLSIHIQARPRNLAQARKDVLLAITDKNPNLPVWSDAGYGYTNINLETEDPEAFWAALEAKLNAKNFKMIVTCQGNEGWDDYRLLYHFDKRLKLDPSIN